MATNKAESGVVYRRLGCFASAEAFYDGISLGEKHLVR
jgi:hypothetical protein